MQNEKNLKMKYLDKVSYIGRKRLKKRSALQNESRKNFKIKLLLEKEVRYRK